VGLFFFCYCSRADEPLANDSIAIGDLVSAYKYNASLFETMRICQETEVIFEDVYYLAHNIPRNSETESEPPSLVEMWQDQNGIVLRKPIEERAKVLFAEGENVNSFFSPAYRDVFFGVCKYGSNQRCQSWFWRSGDKQPLGLEGDNLSDIFENSFAFPPFINSDRFSDRVNNLSPVSSFFRDGTEGMSILGRSNLNGFETVVVVKSKIGESAYKPESIDKERFFEELVEKAWVDVNAGCIPRRIETRRYFLLDGQRLIITGENPNTIDPSDSGVISVFEVGDIKHFASGGNYPVQIESRQFTISPTNRNRSYLVEEIINIIDAGVPAEVPPVTLAVSERKKTKVINLTLDSPIPHGMLNFKYPKGTLVFNKLAGKNYIAGMTDTEYEQLLRDELRDGIDRDRMFGAAADSGMTGVLPDTDSKWVGYIPRAPQGWRTAFTIIGVNFVLLGLIIFAILRKRKS
jgi:hypothetical protein